jgi:hypothetical protein
VEGHSSLIGKGWWAGRSGIAGKCVGGSGHSGIAG